VFVPVTRNQCQTIGDCYDAHRSRWPQSLNLFYGAFNHGVWAIGLTMVFLPTFLKRPGFEWVESFLNVGGMWQPLQKLTYVCYLIHPLVMTFYFCRLNRAVEYSDVTLAFTFVAFVMITFVLSWIIWLLVEKPCANLAACLLAKRSVPAAKEGDSNDK